MAVRNCVGCIYWRKLCSAPASINVCHYLYDTGKMRKRKGNVCLSRTVPKRKKVKVK